MKMHDSDKRSPRSQPQLGLGLMLLSMGAGFGWVGAQPAIAQTIAQTTAQATTLMEPFALVSTEENAEVRNIPSYQPRFSDVVGSGMLVLNANREVTGYYFIVGDLDARTSYAYHFHSASNDGTPTSCEGDKGLVDGEAPGDVVVNLSAIAPLESSSGGFAFAGSSINPVMLPEPVPLASIGYLNIHPAPGGSVGPGEVCANIRLNPGGFPR